MNTLFDKIWDKHVVQVVDDGPTQLRPRLSMACEPVD